MSVRQSLLAILDQGPCYGYQLRAEFDRRTGGAWPINVGQIYTTLDRLERDGRVRKLEADSDGQTFYEITDDGRSEVHGWLDSPVERTTTTRDELAIKLAIAVTLPGVDIARVFRAQHDATSAQLGSLTSMRKAAIEPRSSAAIAAAMVLDSMIATAETELAWLDRWADQWARATSEGLAEPLPIRTDTPRRGRPAKTAAAG